jgi:hypothetical protein
MTIEHNMAEEAVPKQQADEETEKDIPASISATLDEHLGDIAYQLSRKRHAFCRAVRTVQFLRASQATECRQGIREAEAIRSCREYVAGSCR